METGSAFTSQQKFRWERRGQSPFQKKKYRGFMSDSSGFPFIEHGGEEKGRGKYLLTFR